MSLFCGPLGVVLGVMAQGPLIDILNIQCRDRNDLFVLHV